MIDQVLDLIRAKPGDRILHLGIGDGWVSRRLAEAASSGLALGVDPSDDAVRAARKLHVQVENLMFVLGAPEEVPWQDDFFSVVLWTATAADWSRAAREIYRVTAPGGRVFCVNPPPEARSALAAGFAAVEGGPGWLFQGVVLK